MRHCKCERNAPILDRYTYSCAPWNEKREEVGFSQSPALEFGFIGSTGSHYSLQVDW